MSALDLPEEFSIDNLFKFASDMAAMGAGICVACKKEPAEDGLYCFTCAKVKHDIEIDQRECGSGNVHRGSPCGLKSG